MRIVLDTNVLVAAFATQGLCHAVFELCLDQQQIITSDEILRELGAALEKKLKVPPQIANGTLEFMREHALIHRIESPYEKIARDSKDDHVLALAKEGAADYIVTGDEDLLTLGQYEGIPIIQPREFWQIMKKEENRPK
jgi:putative PIN family toxin of toxin-antitoxin system